MDQQQLKRWLAETGREFVVFNTQDLVDAMPFPAGVERLQQTVHEYEALRQRKPSGRVGHVGEKEVPVGTGSKLTQEELTRLVEWAAGQMDRVTLQSTTQKLVLTSQG